MKDGRSNTYLRDLEHVINDRNPTLILCVVPSARGDIYSLIKRKLCVDRAGKEKLHLYIIVYLYYIVITLVTLKSLNRVFDNSKTVLNISFVD